MIEDIFDEIGKIFVGRASELRRLGKLLNIACQDQEHFVYVLLNAPGVGKTTLINHFGRSIESEGKGLFLRFNCSSNYNTPEDFNEDILLKIQDMIREKQDFIINYINSMADDAKQQAHQDNLQIINNKIKKKIAQEKIHINDINFILKRLSTIVPIFFAADEIQEFQKLIFIQSINGYQEEETALHYFTRILKGLMNSRILLMLSGTRYHILSQIGGKIGSPIREKVRPLVIQKFKPEEVNAYVEQVQILIEEAQIEQGAEKIPTLLENYRTFLFAFSGGHPRTIENITSLFFHNLSILISNSKFLEYHDFVECLLPKTEEYFSNSLLPLAYKEALLSLTSSEEFSTVKDWILRKGAQGQFLGERPRIIEDSRSDDEVKRITYELMNIGVIVQNGNYNYHLTSYFHFLEFLKVFYGPYEEFLKQILHNKYFKLMCGRHSGFGYTFENVFLSALIIYGRKIEEMEGFPLKASSLRNLYIVKGKINWFELTIVPNLLYHTPSADVIDAFVLQGTELLLIQITTANPPNHEKFNKLLEEVEIVSNNTGKLEQYQKSKGWLVSLFNFKEKPTIKEDIHVTEGDDLIPILGKTLFDRLREVKESF